MQDKGRTQHEVAALAARQHGVVAARQLERLGYSRERISRECSAGRIHRIHRGVYAVGHRALTPQGRCLAAALACGEESLLSHGSAAWLWGLVGELWLPIEVLADTPRHFRGKIRIHSTIGLRAEDHGWSEGVPVCSVPLTILQMAATRPRLDPGGFLAKAERLGLLDVDAIGELIRDRAGYRGVARLRLALEEFREPVFTRSRLERRFRMLVREFGLPLHSTNYFVAGYEVDAYWPELRFAVELDTYDHHGDARAFEKDRERQEDLKLAGIEMVRITGRRLAKEPRVVMTRLRTLLQNRAQELERQTSR